MFEQFIKSLSQSLQKPLPGKRAQRKMEPYGKALREEAFETDLDPKPSAVLVLLYPYKSRAYTVLMQRNEYEGAHSAQISFPGGRKDKGDASPQHTALREAEEELGIDKSKVKLIGSLSELYIPRSRFLVQPFVGYLEERPVFKPDKNEVQSIIEAPLNLFINESIIKEKIIRVSNTSLKVKAPYFDVNGHVVWGATAAMLSELQEILKGLKVDF